MRFVVSSLIINLILMSVAFGYVQSLGDNGENLNWIKKNNRVEFYVESSNLLTSVQNAIAAWSGHSKITPVYAGQTSYLELGRNEIYYSNDEDYFGEDSAILAITEVAYYEDGSGRIYETDILVDSKLADIYLNDVMTHEMGHALGLGHSEVNDSTMFYSQFFGQNTLHSDDIAGIYSIYPLGTKLTISGKVVGGKELVPILGTHVQAISSQNGSLVATTLSREDGSFSISGLDPEDLYYIYLSPIKYKEALPLYFNTARKDFCQNNSNYRGSFFKKCGATNQGYPQGVYLSNSNRNIGNITIGCEIASPATYMSAKNNNVDFEVSLTESVSNKAFVGYFSKTQIYQAREDSILVDYTDRGLKIGESVQVNLLSSDLYSPVDISIGQAVVGDTISVSLTPDNYDSSELHDPANFLEKDALYFMAANVIDSNGKVVPPLSTTVTDNSLCPDGPLTYNVLAQSSIKEVGSFEGFKKKEADPALVSCGTISDSSGGSGPNIFSSFLFGIIVVLILRIDFKKAWIPIR